MSAALDGQFTGPPRSRRLRPPPPPMEPTQPVKPMQPGSEWIERLRAALAGRKPATLDCLARAAVLVPIVDDGSAPRLLLTRRTEEMPTHAGQVAFPGGLMRDGERDPVRAALREAEEEIGLPPAAAEILGLLDDHATYTGDVAVTPVVAHLRQEPPLRSRSAEVARVFTIPLEVLQRPGLWRVRVESRSGRNGLSGERRLYSLRHDGEHLWGLSARIILDLLALTPAGPVRAPW